MLQWDLPAWIMEQIFAAHRSNVTCAEQNRLIIVGKPYHIIIVSGYAAACIKLPLYKRAAPQAHRVV